MKYKQWQDIPAEVLREFATALRLRYTDRGASQMCGVSVATLQNISNGSNQSDRRTLRAIGELYLKLVPTAFGRLDDGRHVALGRCSDCLPEGEEAALAFIDAIIIEPEPTRDMPDRVNALREWLRAAVRAEYAAEEEFKALRRQRKPKRYRRQKPACG